MLRGLLVTTALLMAAEPILPAPSGDFDVVKYAITQGGLVVVVLVLLWGIRSELRGKDERLKLMTDLVMSATAAQTQSAEAINRMSRALELLAERRGHHE